MAYFPFFVQIEKKQGLIVGGGKVAEGKVEKLLPFGAQLTVVSPRISEKLRKNPAVACILREFEEDDIQGKMFVIAATDDEKLNLNISRLCEERGILVNVVDDKEKCGFLFPSITKRGKLVAAVSTQGASPLTAARFRKEFEALLPEKTEEILDYLFRLRETAKARIPDAEGRNNFFREAEGLCFRKGDVLTDLEERNLFEKQEGLVM